jgi:hypothetical protein
MYALSSLQHILRRPASCAINCRCCPIAIPRSWSTCSGHRSPIASHVGSMAPWDTMGRIVSLCHITRVMLWRNITFLRNIETLPAG